MDMLWQESDCLAVGGARYCRYTAAATLRTDGGTFRIIAVTVEESYYPGE